MFVSKSTVNLFSISRLNDAEFVYYKYNHGEKEAYAGRYSYVGKNKYLFNDNNMFNNTEVITNNKGFYIKLNDEDILFNKISNVPVVFVNDGSHFNMLEQSSLEKKKEIQESSIKIISSDYDYEYKLVLLEKQKIDKLLIGTPTNHPVRSMRDLKYYDGYYWTDTNSFYKKTSVTIDNVIIKLNGNTGALSEFGPGIAFESVGMDEKLNVYKDFEIDKYCLYKRPISSNSNWEVSQFYTKVIETKTYLSFEKIK